MKNKEINEEIEKLIKWAPILLTSIKPVPDTRHVFSQTFRVSGYVHLISIIEDLIKLCAIATATDKPSLSCVIRNNAIDVSSILEMVLQLLPSNEMELLENMVGFVEKTSKKTTLKKNKKQKFKK